MGKTSKPLTILVYGSVYDWEEIHALESQGHIVKWDSSEYDLILGPTTHRMDESLRKWLPDAIQEARRRKYPPGKTKDK